MDTGRWNQLSEVDIFPSTDLSSKCLRIVGIPGLTMMCSVAKAESDLENSAQLLTLGRIHANAAEVSNAEETVEVEVHRPG